MRTILAFGPLGLLLASCSHSLAPMTDCNLPIIPIETELPDGQPLADAPTDICRLASAGQTLEQLLTRAICASSLGGPAGDVLVPPGDFLVLSGGSHNGSYGAGYIEGWGEGGGGLPSFAVVTGISTGSVLSTAAFVGDWRIASHMFKQINHERQLLDTYARKKDGEITWSSIPAIIRNSAVADLAKLENWLYDYADDQVLRTVAARYQKGRGAVLLAGVVDAESGKAVGINLTELADRYASTSNPAVQENARRCYAKAIVASSSAPLAAKPVFIDNRSYIDGGVRYGVFFGAMSDSLKATARRLQDLRDKRARERATRGESKPMPATEVWATRPRMFIINNGTATADPWCDKEWTTDYCAKMGDPHYDATQPRQEWSLLTLGLRAVELMVNQLQRISVTDVQQRYELAFGTDKGFHFTRILPHNLAYEHPIKEPEVEETRTCAKWHDYDEEHLRPVQFHPHFMKCLIAAGRDQALKDKWWVDSRTAP